MRNANTYRGARKKAAKKDNKIWRLLPYKRALVGKRMQLVIKNPP